MHKSDKLSVLAIGLIIIGIFDTAYLSWVKLADTQVFCGGAANCESVNSSVYSEIFNIPIAYLGLVAYIFLAILFLLEKRASIPKDISSLLRFATCLIGSLYSIYLTYIEIAVIRAICPYCILSAILMILLLALAIIRGWSYLTEI
jgi:uncharacterized membrane protein